MRFYFMNWEYDLYKRFLTAYYTLLSYDEFIKKNIFRAPLDYPECPYSNKTKWVQYPPQQYISIWILFFLLIRVRSIPNALRTCYTFLYEEWIKKYSRAPWNDLNAVNYIITKQVHSGPWKECEGGYCIQCNCLTPPGGLTANQSHLIQVH